MARPDLLDSSGTRGVVRVLDWVRSPARAIFTVAFWDESWGGNKWDERLDAQIGRTMATGFSALVLFETRGGSLSVSQLNPESVLFAATMAFTAAGMVDIFGLVLQGLGGQE